MGNTNVEMTLTEAVSEVLRVLTGLDLSYRPEQDRFQVITNLLNRALRLNALENEWSYYASTEEVGTVDGDERRVALRSNVRPRILGDDSVTFQWNGRTVAWAQFVPRDALSGYEFRKELRVAATKNALEFSRPLPRSLAGTSIHVPVMREPVMFRLPPLPVNPEDPIPDVPQDVLDQIVDFDYPDVIIARAVFIYSQTDPIMQPRSQVLEQQWKDLMYALTERDSRHTDAPMQNDFLVPITNGVDGGHGRHHLHPHSSEW